MFKFDFKETFPCSPGEIMQRSMYNFDEYAKFAPNVTRVEVVSREKQPDGREYIVIRVFAKGWLPPLVLKMFNQSEIFWHEHYWVDLQKLTVDWKVETPVFTKYVDCKGTSSCLPDPGGSMLVVTGDMKIGIPPIPGVPEPVVRATLSAVEPFIGRLVILNLQKYFRSISDCMKKEKKSIVK